MLVKKNKVGLTFGCFDMFHYGHMNLLIRAGLQCDILVVCISDDEYMLKHKGKKAILPFKEREKHVSWHKSVFIVDKQTLKFGKKEAIEKYNPDVLFVGDDHKDDYGGAGLGIPVVYLPHTDKISSTIIRKTMD